MRFTKRTFLWMALLSLTIASCGGGAPAESADQMMEKTEPAGEAMPTHDAMSSDMQTTPGSAVESSGDMMMTAPDWYAVSMMNVNTGETFTVNDLKGRVILVETMAVWCTNCFRQQSQVKILHEKLGERDDFISLGLDIDPNEDAAKLSDFVQMNGFDWMYAVSPPDVSREIASLYGAQFLNPPSTPMLIIDRNGEAHLLPFGIKSSDDLLAVLQPYLDEEV